MIVEAIQFFMRSVYRRYGKTWLAAVLYNKAIDPSTPCTGMREPRGYRRQVRPFSDNHLQVVVQTSSLKDDEGPYYYIYTTLEEGSSDQFVPVPPILIVHSVEYFVPLSVFRSI